MKLFAKIVTLILLSVLGGLLSLVVTWYVWQTQITEKAFHCTDDNISGFWVSMDTHRAAGDTVFPGWTWEKLKTVRMIYETAFYFLWFVISFASFLVLFRRFRFKKESNKQTI
jgi:hypothetical protein